MSYKVAVSTSDNHTIDWHFGQTTRFSIFEVNENDASFNFVDRRQVQETQENKKPDEKPSDKICYGHSDSHLEYVSELLKDCTYLLTAKIGKRPYKILLQNGLNSLEAPPDLSDAIAKLNSYYILHKEREKRTV